QCVKISISNTHARMGRLHVFPSILAGATTRLTDLVYELSFKGRNVGISKKTINTAVPGNTSDKIIDNGRDSGVASQAVVQCLLLGCHLFPSRCTTNQDSQPPYSSFPPGVATPLSSLRS